MKEKIIELVSLLSLPPEGMTFLLSALPITELRASIPFAHGVLNLSLPIAFFWAFLGSLVPGLFILLVGEKFISWGSTKSRWFEKKVMKKLEKTRYAFGHKYEKHGALGLVIFVGVPLPFTGVWTGSLAALVFGIPFKKAFPLIVVGNAFAGIAVTLATVGIFTAVNGGV